MLMLEHARRKAAPACCVALLLVAPSCTNQSAGDESGLQELPPITWRDHYIEFGSDVETEVCLQTLPVMNEYMQGVDEYVRSNTIYPVRYYHLRDELEDYGLGCIDDAWGCAHREGGGSIIGSKRLSLRHELIHASSLVGQHRLLEEGLAVFLGTDLEWRGIADPLEIRAAFESVDGSARFLPPEFYPVAGHFVSYLVEQHGLPASVSLVEASATGMTFDELDALFVEHLGRDLDVALDAYEAAGPGCEVAQYSPMWFECELSPPSIPIFACDPVLGRIMVDVSLACDEDASGVEDGKIWRDILIEANAPELVLIYLYEGHPVDFVVRGCGQGCATPFARVSSQTAEEGLILQAFELREGLSLIRISKPIEAEGRVRFSIGGVCP